MADRSYKDGKFVTMPKETYIKDSGSGKCRLLLNPNDMQIGTNYGDEYWLLGNQFMQSYYTIYDLNNWRVGMVQSKNSFDSGSGGGFSLPTQGVNKKMLKEVLDEGNSKEETKTAK